MADDGHLPTLARVDNMALPQWVVDQIPSREGSPLQTLMDAEAKSDAWVRVFLTGCQAWPAPPDAHGRCGVCHDLPLAKGWYCGNCDRPKGSEARKRPKIAACDKAVAGVARVKTRKEKRAGRKAA